MKARPMWNEVEWHNELVAHWEDLYNQAKYEQLCQEFCHEGLSQYQDQAGQLHVFVCSEEVLASDFSTGIKELATRLITKVRRSGYEGC